MFKIIKKNFLTICVFIAIILAYCTKRNFPNIDTFPQITKTLFIAIFFIQGYQLSLASINKSFKKTKIIILATFFCFIYCPLITYNLNKILLGSTHYITIGITLISCMGPTIISGTIIAKNSDSDHNLAIILTLLLSFLSIFTIPFSIVFLLGQTINFNTNEFLNKIIFLVLIPTIIGYLFKKMTPKQINLKPILSYTPTILLGILIFFSFLPHILLLSQIKLSILFSCVALTFVLHQLCFLTSFKLTQHITNDYATSGATAICSTQKTLPLAIIIWTEFFAKSYPLALLPLITFHFTQLYGDTLFLQLLKNKFHK